MNCIRVWEKLWFVMRSSYEWIITTRGNGCNTHAAIEFIMWKFLRRLRETTNKSSVSRHTYSGEDESGTLKSVNFLQIVFE